MTPDQIANLFWAFVLCIVGVAWAVAWAARQPQRTDIHLHHHHEP